MLHTVLWRRVGHQAVLDAQCKSRVVVALPEYEQNDGGIVLGFQGWTNDFHLLQGTYTGTGSAECLSRLFFFPGSWRPECEADHLAWSTETENTWNRISFLACTDIHLSVGGFILWRKRPKLGPVWATQRREESLPVLRVRPLFSGRPESYTA
jgi:hypothetical protein